MEKAPPDEGVLEHNLERIKAILAKPDFKAKRPTHLNQRQGEAGSGCAASPETAETRQFTKERASRRFSRRRDKRDRHAIEPVVKIAGWVAI